jgi:hypothetical protein
MHKLLTTLVVFAALLLAGCGGKGTTKMKDAGLDGTFEEVAEVRGDVHIVPTDTAEPMDFVPGDVEPEAKPTDVLPDQPPVDIWTPQECQSHDDCEGIGLCVEVAPGSGQMVCAPFCLEECPADWECKSVYVDGPDPVSLCFPPTQTICSVCNTDAQCIYAGSLCLKGSGALGFCGKYCHLEDSPDCPAGFECRMATGKNGESLGYQCQPPLGDCCVAGKLKDCDDDNPCTADLCDPSLGCQHKNIDGPCEGPEPCADYKCINGACIGLPITEDLILDGIDEDCDGEIDEDWALAGRVLAPVFAATSHIVKGGGLTIRGILSGPPAVGVSTGGDFKVTPALKLKKQQ